MKQAVEDIAKIKETMSSKPQTH